MFALNWSISELSEWNGTSKTSINYIIHHNLIDLWGNLTLLSQSSIENGWGVLIWWLPAHSKFLQEIQRKSPCKCLWCSRAAFCEHTLSSGQSILDLTIWMPELLSVGSSSTTVCKTRIINKMYHYGNENLCLTAT